MEVAAGQGSMRQEARRRGRCSLSLIYFRYVWLDWVSGEGWVRLAILHRLAIYKAHLMDQISFELDNCSVSEAE